MTETQLERLYELAEKWQDRTKAERDEYDKLCELYEEEEERKRDEWGRGQALSEAYGPETIWDVHGRL